MPSTLAVAAEGGPTVEFADVLVAVGLVVLLARLLALAAKRVGQPPVIGEILAGLLLGTTFLGQVHLGGASLTEHLFPVDTRPALSVLANLGLVIFMFIVGMELDLKLIRGHERLALTVSVVSVALPMGLGAALGLLLHGRHDQVDGSSVDRLAFVLFLGASMSVTAFPVLARILTDRGLQRSPLGVVALACAAVDDVLAWSLLALVSAVAAQRSAAGADVPSVWSVLALSAVYLTLMATAVRGLLRRLVPLHAEAGRLTPDLLAALLVGLLLSAWATEQIGIHFIFGAFVFGACLPREGTEVLFAEVLQRLEQVSVLLLLPVFFIVTGLSVDLTSFERATLGELALVLLVAVVSKFGGAYLAGLVQGMPARRAAALGLLMNTRGLTELVLLSVGQRLGVLDTQMYSMLVVMAIVTTVMTSPLLRLVYPDRVLLREVAEAERARTGDVRPYRVMAALPDPRDADGVVGLAVDACGGDHPAEVVLVSLPARPAPPSELGSGLTEELASLAETLSDLRRLESLAAARGVAATTHHRFSDDPARDLVLLAVSHDVDVVLVPAEGVTTDAASLAAAADALVAATDALVATWTGPVPEGAPVVVAPASAGDAATALAVRLSAGREAPLRLLTAADGHPRPRRIQHLAAQLREVGLDARAVEDVPADHERLLVHGSGGGTAVPGSVTVIGSREVVESEVDVAVRALAVAAPAGGRASGRRAPG